HEAVHLCKEFHPDIVLMDINMPHFDGVQATKMIKELYPEIKIIILTSYKEIDYVLSALSHGAEGYLLKAINPKHLVAGIRVVHLGGTLISQDMASDVVQRLKERELNGEHKENKATKAKTNDFELSSREITVLQKLANGLRNQEIAESLFLSEGTVKNYISNIYAKLNVKGRVEATKKAREAGLVKVINQDL
ncbi:LuxR C-terminal-related transcriptional regulator, partial [Paenibacillus xylaniclasticus]|uniref:LuxR C-terminal-related transcriptional regulator n=1 Tax=Paenibacillus xylaniclasticus TaxID=588083 RepID=UPI0013DF5B39